MAVLDVEVRVRRDGEDIEGSPFVRRITLTEATEFDSTIPSTQTSLGGIPGVALATATALILNPQNTLTLQLNGGANFVVNPGALVLILDAQLTGTSVAQVSNATGAAVEILGLEAGP